MKQLPLNTHTFFRRATGVAEHYGFCSVDDLCNIQQAPEVSHVGMDIHKHQSDEAHFDHDVLSSILCHIAQSVELRKRRSLLFYTPSTVTSPALPALRMSAITLNAVGVQDPLQEIMVIKTAVSILEELGVKRYVVRVNSIGDTDSVARFMREAGNRLRVHVRDLPEEYALMVRTNMPGLIAKLFEERHPLTAELPIPLDHLTSPSRKYFKEVLELLEHMNIPFTLDERLYGAHNMYAHTMYEIAEESPDEAHATGGILARGGRYDNLTRAYARSAIPAAGIVIALETKEHHGTLGKPLRKKALACLVHIGREARIRSIQIVDTFRRERIPIEQCFHYERFSDQLSYAQTRDAKYVIILGQREVHENVVIVRSALDRSQKTIPIHLLPEYVRGVC